MKGLSSGDENRSLGSECAVLSFYVFCIWPCLVDLGVPIGESRANETGDLLKIVNGWVHVYTFKVFVFIL